MVGVGHHLSLLATQKVDPDELQSPLNLTPKFRLSQNLREVKQAANLKLSYDKIYDLPIWGSEFVWIGMVGVFLIYEL